MKASLFLSVGVLSLTSMAFANSELDGTWKFQKMECSSGAKPTVQLSPQKTSIGNGNYMTYNMTTKFQGNKGELNMKYEISLSPTSPEVQKNLQEVDAAIAAWTAQPDSAEKQAAIKQMADGKAQYLETLKQGFTCETNTKSTVKIYDGKFEIGDDEVTTSKCSPEGVSDDSADETDEDTGAPTKYVVQGNILKTYNSQDDLSIDVGAGDIKMCPTSDEVVMYFQRQ